MNDKKILIALTPRDSGSNALNFAEKYIQGENLDITLLLIHDTDDHETHREDLVDRFYSICSAKNIHCRMKELVPFNGETLATQLMFADLLIIESHGLKVLTFAQTPNLSACPVLLVPKAFESLKNILLAIDGSHVSLASIKQFFQIFSRSSRDMDVTLLWVTSADGSDMIARDEMMLVEYIRQHCKNLGILKVQSPLTAKLMRPVHYNDQTLVVGSHEFLLELGQTGDSFNPLVDMQSTIFLSGK